LLIPYKLHLMKYLILIISISITLHIGCQQASERNTIHANLPVAKQDNIGISCGSPIDITYTNEKLINEICSRVIQLNKEGVLTKIRHNIEFKSEKSNQLKSFYLNMEKLSKDEAVDFLLSVEELIKKLDTSILPFDLNINDKTKEKTMNIFLNKSFDKINHIIFNNQK